MSSRISVRAVPLALAAVFALLLVAPFVYAQDADSTGPPQASEIVIEEVGTTSTLADSSDESLGGETPKLEEVAPEESTPTDEGVETPTEDTAPLNDSSDESSGELPTEVVAESTPIAEETPIVIEEVSTSSTFEESTDASSADASGEVL